MCGTDQQVYVIAHQHVSVNGKLLIPSEQAEQPQIVVPIIVVDEDRAAIHSAMSDVQRYAGQFKSRPSRHGRYSSFAQTAVSPVYGCRGIGVSRPSA